MRVLIAPDKFKGTLSAAAAAQAIAAGWRKIRPADLLTLLPMSDGGDGFGPVLADLMGAQTLSLETTNAAGRPHRARWWWVERSRIAIVEAAQSNGLALLQKGLHHPFDLDTHGVARLIRFALARGARQCLVGVGGSATNDGGFGLARALGWRFLDRHGGDIQGWPDLARLHSLAPPVDAKSRVACRFIVATDVDNPLLGRRGASRVYGPQKGLRPDDIRIAEAALRRLAAVVQRQLGLDIDQPGDGAAGGLGFGLRAFLKADRRLGFDVFAKLARLDQRLRQADLVITGEGAFDEQSLMGKGVGQLVQRCAARKRPVIVLAGRLTAPAAHRSGAIRVARSLCELAPEADAQARPAWWLRRLAADVAVDWSRPRAIPP